MAEAKMTAVYTSPEYSRHFSAKLPQLPGDVKAQSVIQKTTYLSALRSGTMQIQADINAFLTERMEADKLPQGGGTGKAQEEKEEEMYGEEDPEADG
ncbi:hypothetical protein LTR78_010696 [Recurvomyces mirabilis]|uniref:EKC/KEOPS complex subunit GON7 n=1 Tax=Recurvomyces mirabilis TaxID=574656 RepID=A0AAE0TRM7_9PEZI|nr:hypothetical protein LTR78_010696 [Recurvomyces mirabilis]KAK5158247.1 hypothetical protein LTS14_003265 [Recurvomyces mirabilis]